MGKALAAVDQACHSGANLVPSTLEAVRAYATVGEICNVWRANFGSFSPSTRAAAAGLSPGVRALNLRHGDPASESSTWRPPVLETVAPTGAGTTELADVAEAFLRWATTTSRIARKRQHHIEQHLLRLLTARLIEPFVSPTEGISSLARQAQRIAAGQASPQEAAEELALLVIRPSA